ncbi:MAG: hypothetical protein FWG54_02680, partial [Bacteroidetes bacterium]|nr:hypothetical protein [Bacteroidota bacterium]
AIYTENTNFSISPISPATSYVYWRNATHTDPGGAGALWPSSAPRYLPDDNDKYVKIQIPGPLTHNVSLSPTGTYAFSNEAYGYDPVTPQMVTVTNTGSDATGILTVTLGGVNPSSFLCSTTTIANLAVYGNTGSFTVKPVDGLGVGTYTAIATVTGSNAISASLDLSFTVREADIGSVAILVTDPVPGESPNATATGTGNVSMGTVSWNPGHDPFQGSTPYTATVTLTAHTGYTFSGLTSATINGETATVTDNTGDKVTLSYTFGATTAATLTAISIETQPAKLTYSFGETLDLTGLSVKLQYNDATSKVVPFSNFGTNSISVSPAQGTLLTLLHNGTVVGVSSGIFSANTNPLTVNAASITNVVVTVTEPVAGGTPNETATGVGNFSIGQVTWTPNDLSFGYNISYTATVTLTAQNGYTFTGLTSATINGETATVTGNTGDKVTLSCAFESIQSLIPVFDGLLESYGTGASVPLKVKGFRWEKFTVFRINGADVSTHPLFVPQIPGVYLIEACSAGGSLQLWKYVTVY